MGRLPSRIGFNLSAAWRMILPPEVIPDLIEAWRRDDRAFEDKGGWNGMGRPKVCPATGV